MLTFDLFTSKVKFASLCICMGYIHLYWSIEVIHRSTVAKIVLIGNLRWQSSCLCFLYFPATVLFTCIKSWFFRNHLANFHQISHWSYCWNVIDSLFKWSHSIDCQAHIFFFRTKNCSNDDLFTSCDDRIGNICSGYFTQVSELWPVALLLFLLFLRFHSCSSFFSSLSLSFISAISSISFLPFSGRWHEMTRTSWRVKNPNTINQSTDHGISWPGAKLQVS